MPITEEQNSPKKRGGNRRMEKHFFTSFKEKGKLGFHHTKPQTGKITLNNKVYYSNEP